MARRTTAPTTELGRQLEKERENRNLTMQGMAGYLGVAKPTYLGWLRGVRPQPHHLQIIASKLDTKPASVLGWVLGSGLLVITWTEGEEVHPAIEDWFPRPIDIDADTASLIAA